MAKASRSKRFAFVPGVIDPALGRIVAAERKRAGLSQVRLARLIGRRQGWVSRVECCDQQLQIDELLELAEVIGFDPVAVARTLTELASGDATRAARGGDLAVTRGRPLRSRPAPDFTNP
jgi:transcriptional regulator with XRE-family HTH domain